MALLRADLQAFANGMRRRDGHGGLAARLLPPLLLGAMYWMLGSMMLEHQELLSALHSRGDAQSILMAAALSPCPIVSGWIAFAHMHRQLFEAPELGLWLTAPIWRGRAAVQVLLRAIGNAMIWACALTAPFVLQLLWAGGAPFAAYLALPLAVAFAVLPSLAVTLGTQILMMRFASGRLARTLLGLTSAVASFGFPVFLLTEVFAGAPARVMTLVDPGSVDRGPSPLVADATHLMAAAARGVLDATSLRAGLLAVAVTCIGYLLVAPMHPIAAQHHLLAYKPRRLHGGRLPWLAASAIRHKEFAQTLQQPGAIWQMVIVGTMTCLLASQNLIVHDILEPNGLPLWVRQCAAMAMLWCLAVTMLLYTHMGRLAIWDGMQWPLYMKAPITPATLLRGKLQTIALLLIWPIGVTAFCGVRWFGATTTTVTSFLGFATAGTMAALAAIAAVGTWPWLVRREADGSLTQGSRGFVGSLALMVVFHLGLAPAYVLFQWLTSTPRGRHADHERLLPWALGGALLLGLAQFVLAARVALHNYRRLLAPR